VRKYPGFRLLTEKEKADHKIMENHIEINRQEKTAVAGGNCVRRKNGYRSEESNSFLIHLVIEGKNGGGKSTCGERIEKNANYVNGSISFLGGMSGEDVLLLLGLKKLGRTIRIFGKKKGEKKKRKNPGSLGGGGLYRGGRSFYERN